MTDDKIHSYDTFDTYQKACQRFGKWLQEEKDINRKADINNCKEFAKEYIQYRLDVDRVSVWNAKMERSALSKLYGEKIEIDMPKRDTKDIVRSRGEKEQDKDFKDKILAKYPTRHEYKIIKDKETGESRTYEIQSGTYTTRGENKQTFDRDEAYICTCALGHERLEVTVTHYLKQ